MTSIRNSNSAQSSAPRGFTLVEMLVAVGLVVLMMTLFATVFQIATGAMSKQKGLAENDQKARLVQTMLMGDLHKRTYRNVWPWEPEESGTRIRVSASYRQGYFYISENDPTDHTDDVLQFTIAVFHKQKNKDESPLYGRSVPLKHSSVGMNVNQYAESNPQQPEFDDGQANVDFTSSSTIGEVAYFLRNGILYRRLMLVRTPFVDVVDGTPRGVDNMNQPDQELIDAAYVPGPPAYAPTGSGVFWRDFDFSAVNLHGLDGAIYPDRPTFIAATQSGDNYLDNSWESGIPAGDLVKSLGMPNMRWGFNVGLSNGTAGKPREYVDRYKATATGTVQTGDTYFIGRFTHEETSHEEFKYPGSFDSGLDPYNNADLVLITDRGVVEQYQYTGVGGTRRGEDILMTNVHAFDIKVYDDNDAIPETQRFVDVGNTIHSGTGADPAKDPTCFYCQDENDDGQDFGPHAAGDDENNIFDTWHPNFDLNPGDMNLSQPPYRPWDKGPDGAWGEQGVDDDGDGMIDNETERGWPDTDDRPHPLKAIQIHIRYLDPVSNQMRDLTMIQSLVD